MKEKTNNIRITKGRLIMASIVFVVGFLSPLLIPLVTSSQLNTTFKTTLSGLLAFGIPELAMLVAVAIAGKQGFDIIKSRMMRVITFISPDQVSKPRYYIGLVMFTLPLIFGFLYVYIDPIFDLYSLHRITYSIISDLIFVFSIFVLGGNFWDKLRSLFIYNSTVKFGNKDV